MATSPSPRQPHQLSLILVTSIASLVWGTTYLVTTELLPPAVPLWSSVLRALPGGVLVLLLTRRLPSGVWWWRSVVLGTLNFGAFFALLFAAGYLLPGGVAAIFGAAAPLLVAVLALPLAGERPTLRRVLWGLVAVLGILLLVAAPGGDFPPLALAAGAGAPIAMSLGTVLTKRWGMPVGPVTFTGWQMTAGGLVIVPLALLLEGPPPPLDAPALLGYGWVGLVGGLLAYVLWFRGLRRMSAGAAAFLPVLAPLTAAILGWIVLGEGLGPIQLLGFAIALAAVIASQTASRERRRRHTGGGQDPREGEVPPTGAG